MNKKSCILITAPGLFVELLLFLVATGLFVLEVLRLQSEMDERVVVFLILLTVSFQALLLITCHRWLAFLLFNSDGITYYALFQKKQFRPYNKYCTIKQASYTMWGFPIRHIVLSTEILFDNKAARLNQVNSVGMSADHLKLRINKRVYRRLMNALPSDMQKRVGAIFKSCYE